MIEVASPCGNWTVDTACCDNWGEYSPEVTGRAATMAVHYLWRATGRRFGICDLTVRPCKKDCVGFASTYNGGYSRPPGLVSGQSLSPTIVDGRWYNISGGVFSCSTCFCGNPEMVELPTAPVIDVTEIQVDGVAIDLAGFQIIGPNTLVAPPGFSFPTCQSIATPLGEEGTWGVTYTHGRALPPDAAYAAGLLACEFAKACVGEKCRLPGNLERMTQRGIVQSFDPSKQITGIHEVDLFIKGVNPAGLTQRSTVTTPETIADRGAVTRWVGT